MQHISEILPDFSKLGVKVKALKRMMEIEERDKDIPLVKINSSSMNLINTCKRKAFYALECGYRSESIGEAVVFGKAIHAGLEAWYLNNQDNDKAIEGFLKEAEPLNELDSGNKRHPDIGVKILKNYFEQYQNDYLEIYEDKDGPFIERDFEFLLSKTPYAEIWYFGRVDQAVYDSKVGQVILVDHKTTSSLGKDFFNRIKPNFQFTGYVLGAREQYGLDINTFLVNGIQVGKTDRARNLTRERITYSEDDFDEFVHAVEETVHD